VLARDIVILMATATRRTCNPVSDGSSTHIHGVPVAIIPLPREVSFRMAVHTSWVMQHRDHRLKSRSRYIAMTHHPGIILSGHRHSEGEHHNEAGYYS
jgi:hypothetical protein